MLYIAVCVYIARRVGGMCQSKTARIACYLVVAFMTLLFPFHHLLMGYGPEWLNRIIYMVSTTWLVVVLYGFVMHVIFDIARVIARLKKGEWPERSSKTVWNTIAITGLIIICGVMNAYTPQVTHYEVKNEKLNEGDTLRFVVVSDLHAGYAIRKGDMERVKNMVNAQDADFCFIVGDIFDGDTRPVTENDLCAPLREIKTRKGTYAVLGNHEYIGGADVAAEYLRTLKLTLLRDSAVVCSTTSFDMKPYICIIGRDDMSRMRMDKECKELGKMDNDTCEVKIVLDHQPGRVLESVAIGADLHISGHTHAGQVWPMRMFTKMMYANDYGHTRLGDTDVVVTSGFGTWGPRVRVGTSPEVVVIEMTK